MTKKKSSRTQKISWSGTKKETNWFKSIPKQKFSWISWKWFVTDTAELHRKKLVLKTLTREKYYSCRGLFTQNYVKRLRRLNCSKGRRRVTRPSEPSKHSTLTLTIRWLSSDWGKGNFSGEREKTRSAYSYQSTTITMLIYGKKNWWTKWNNYKNHRNQRVYLSSNQSETIFPNFNSPSYYWQRQCNI